MGARSAGEQHVRSLQKNNTGSYTVSLPIQLVRKLRWQERQRLVVRQSGSKLIIEGWHP